jgi:hypothetical protein
MEEEASGKLIYLKLSYCWTGGYGWSGAKYEAQSLNQNCPECRQLNDRMHKIVSELFNLEYRDKGGWWVRAWFIY